MATPAIVYIMALFSEAQVDIRSQSDDGGFDDVKSGMFLPGGVVIGADMMKGTRKYRGEDTG
jgi:hypothetical protein